MTLCAADVDHVHGAVFLGRYPHATVVRFDRHALGLLADAEALDDLTGVDVHDAGLCGILVRDVHVGTVRAHGDLFWIGTAREHLDQLPLIQVHDPNAVSRSIGRRQRLLVHARACVRRAAERDVQPRTVRADGDPRGVACRAQSS